MPRDRPPANPKLGQIEFFNEDIDREPDCLRRSSLPGIQEKRALTAIDPLNEAPHPILPQITRES